MQQVDKQCYASCFQATDLKHVPTATIMNIAYELLLETLFSTWPVQSGYKKDNFGDPVESHHVKKELVVSFQLKFEICTAMKKDVERMKLLDAVAREWLMKTKQPGKVLEGALLIFKVWRLATVL